MEVYIERETDNVFDFDYEELIREVVVGAVDYINCPYESTVNVTLVDNDSIKEINSEHRGIDKATDVLSFPMIEYEIPGNFDNLEGDEYNDCFDPDTGELMLGDIVISVDKVNEQAKEYGHSIKRELGFLVAHSMFHLFGYDHMEDEERIEMESLQKELLNKLGITRDEAFDSTIKSAKVVVDNDVLILEAKKAMEFAYAPYSKFKVGAAIATKSGKIYTGCNVENASFGATICAERTAAVKAVSAGSIDFEKIVIVSSAGEFTPPCGICRQFLSEFNPELVVILENKLGKIKEYKLSELLPDSFNL